MIIIDTLFAFIIANKYNFMEFKVRILNGRCEKLYVAVGELVLSAACLRENNNYPYKSSRKLDGISYTMAEKWWRSYRWRGRTG